MLLGGQRNRYQHGKALSRLRLWAAAVSLSVQRCEKIVREKNYTLPRITEKLEDIPFFIGQEIIRDWQYPKQNTG